MDGTSAAEEEIYMDYPHLPSTPDIFMILGVISFSVSVIWTHTGKAWVRYYGWIHRAEEPGVYWWNVVTGYLVGVIFIGIAFYLVT
jgi:hypothetical protein